MDVIAYNRAAWDREVERGNRWSTPVSASAIAAARQGDWQVVLTPRKPVPRSWFPPLPGISVLCLAGAGGQQAPILAAAGARVTVFDNSPRQLEQDRFVAERDGLALETVLGDMSCLAGVPDAAFDLVFHPCSNCFVPDIPAVWREAFRVLRAGGTLLSGFCNPIVFLFDPERQRRGVLQMKYAMPYSDIGSLTHRELHDHANAGEPMVFGHSLEDQIGAQIEAGFVLTGFYEDCHDDSEPLIPNYFPGFMATRAYKLSRKCF
jgi:SAM-dependent methyltransferase